MQAEPPVSRETQHSPEVAGRVGDRVSGSEGSDASELMTLAAEIFGDRLDLAQRYHDHLASTGVEWGLVGPREVPILWERHLLNCALAVSLVPENAAVVDVGSGAGLPGLVWALARPDLRITLAEPLLRRTRWLHMVIDDLDLDVRVVRARAEELPAQYPDVVPSDVITARAVAALAQLGTWVAPLLDQHGTLLALKGRSAADEVRRDSSRLRSLGLVAEVLECADPRLTEATRVVRVIRSTGPARRTQA